MMRGGIPRPEKSFTNHFYTRASGNANNDLHLPARLGNVSRFAKREDEHDLHAAARTEAETPYSFGNDRGRLHGACRIAFGGLDGRCPLCGLSRMRPPRKMERLKADKDALTPSERQLLWLVAASFLPAVVIDGRRVPMAEGLEKRGLLMRAVRTRPGRRNTKVVAMITAAGSAILAR